jgi:hypothetical protein
MDSLLLSLESLVPDWDDPFPCSKFSPPVETVDIVWEEQLENQKTETVVCWPMWLGVSSSHCPASYSDMHTFYPP